MKATLSKLAKSSVTALTVTATAAFGQSSHTVEFYGNTINCEKLQGRLDPVPGGFTCGFAQEIDKYMSGQKLNCGDNEGYSFSSMIPAADHMATFHGQPGLLQHTWTDAALVQANNNIKAAAQYLNEKHPGQAADFYFAHRAIESMVYLLRSGDTFDQAFSKVVADFNQKGMTIPGDKADGIDSLKSFLRDNPAVDARLICLANYPDIPWSTYEH